MTKDVIVPQVNAIHMAILRKDHQGFLSESTIARVHIREMMVEMGIPEDKIYITQQIEVGVNKDYWKLVATGLGRVQTRLTHIRAEVANGELRTAHEKANECIGILNFCDQIIFDATQQPA